MHRVMQSLSVMVLQQKPRSLWDGPVQQRSLTVELRLSILSLKGQHDLQIKQCAIFCACMRNAFLI